MSSAHHVRVAVMTQTTWFITGSSSGLGRELTRHVLEGGHRVAATVRKPDALADLEAVHGDRLRVLRLDVTDTAAVRTAVDDAFRDFGPIDVVVNNAGYGLLGAAEDLSDEQINRQVATNLVAPIQVARAAVPRLREQGGGRLVQISSAGGQAAFPGISVYHATKWGLEGFSESLAAELAPFGIHVTIVEPGTIRTAFGGNLDLAPISPAYEGTPVRAVRDLSTDPTSAIGDPARMAARVAEAALRDNPPLRLVLGSDAYGVIHTSLTDRLTGITAQRDDAALTDI